MEDQLLQHHNCKHKESEKGPAWANSLFEDNAEFGFGMAVGVEKLRDRITIKMHEAIDGKFTTETKEAMNIWIENKDNANGSVEASKNVIDKLKKEDSPLAKEILALEQYMIKKSQWIFGGDGWAYDIGYGGLDHVLASGEDVNVLVLDTEVYSNTGGQASKSTPSGSVAKFAASGKKIRKKDLGAMAMTYGYVYVAQIAMGASQSQAFKAFKEAEAYPGPSLIIAYSPCIAHGIKGGMSGAMNEEKFAVEVGYWHNYRYNPTIEGTGKNPFSLDSKEPDWTKYQDFLNNEVRYASLKKSFPEEARKLFAQNEADAKWKYKNYVRQANMDFF